MALNLKWKKALVEADVSPVVETVPQTVKVQPGVTDVEQLTAEYLELYKKFVYFEVKSMTKRMDEIRKQLHALANETMDNAKPAVFTCPQGEMLFSERGKTTEVVDPLVLIQDLTEKFGAEVAASVVNIALTPLRSLLSEFEMKKYVIEQPGIRTLRSVRPS